MEATPRFTIRVVQRADEFLVVKSGRGPLAVATLRREAGILRALPHPGLIELVGLQPDDRREPLHIHLATRFAGAHTLHSSPGVPPSLAVTRAGQLLATLAALHGRGLTHGAVEAAHVVIGPTGAARWCGLARVQPATLAARLAEVRATANLALGDLVRSRRRGTGRRERRLLAAAQTVLLDERLDAAALTAALTTLLTPFTSLGPRNALGRTSLQSNGDLVGEQPPSHGEDQVVTMPLDESTQHLGEVSWWQR